jgi:pimeloyl-ACP methyl ester carboxylesterase
VKRIIFIHGKNPKPPATEHRQLLLRCLLEGIHRIDPDVASDIRSSDSFSLVAWSRLFYGRSREITGIRPWVDRLLEQETHQAKDISDARPLKYRVARAMYYMGDAVPWIIPLIPDRRIKNSIRETETYFSNHDNVACKVRELQKQVLREAAGNGDQVLLIGHSMGSIIAYDALWELHHLEGMDSCVDCFLTIGSPLGMKYVQRRLIGMKGDRPHSYPGNIRSWVNISARGDLVALDPSLEDDFADMLTQRHIEKIDDHRKAVFNYYRDAAGLNVHKSYGYLVNPVVADVITEWWRAA